MESRAARILAVPVIPTLIPKGLLFSRRHDPGGRGLCRPSGYCPRCQMTLYEIPIDRMSPPIRVNTPSK
jgi:hypothetical protein